MIATDRLDYPLPQELIAQVPASRRDGSRLLVVDRARRTLEHRAFGDFPGYLRKGDTLFRNNASVLPARLHGQRPTGGSVECLLLRNLSSSAGPGPEAWKCLVRPARRLPVGSTFEAAKGELSAEILEHLADGSVIVHLTSRTGEPVAAVANRVGRMPLPPYIERKDGTREDEDRVRYQTVYANSSRQVAAAAPTAGLHFTEEILAAVRDRGVGVADLTLHVGLGTFRPIATASVEEHPIHAEVYEIPDETQKQLFGPREGRRIAIGTTSVRSIEDFLSRNAAPLGRTHLAEASLFIYPPRTFVGVDSLLTNFHQPRSTLLCLVAAFLTPGSADGIDWLMEIYREAIDRRYRFFSYGDAMLIL